MIGEISKTEYDEFMLKLNVFSTTIFAINHAYWYTTISSILALIISAIEFAINSKKHNEYKLMYEEYNHEERQLFPDDYKF